MKPQVYINSVLVLKNKDDRTSKKLKKNVTSASFYQLFFDWGIRILISCGVLQSPTEPAHRSLDSEHKNDMYRGRV